MHHRSPELDSTRHILVRWIVLTLVGMTWTTVGRCAEPIRIWVDSSGRYSVEAALVRRDDDRVVLRRKDGGQSSMPISLISKRDLEYLAQYDQQQKDISESPQPVALTPPRFDPLSRLDLPSASFVAAENTPLQFGVVTETTAHLQKAPAITPDPSPDELQLPLTKLPIDNVNPYDRCSELAAVGTAGAPAVGMSITVGFTLSGSSLVNRIIKFDLAENAAKVIYQSEVPVTLLDHHVDSRRSLVLVGHGATGQGGRLAIATGWRSDDFEINYSRRLPGDDQDYREFNSTPPHLRWARWIDDENIVAIVDRSLVGWNLVSGEMNYRIDGIDAGSTPALSGGRRYLALPVVGGVQLYDTEAGKSLGRVPAEPRVVPAISFSRQGHALAISSQRRLMVWDLARATKSMQLDTVRSLGSGAPVWIDSDLILSGSGVLVSIQRQATVWRYHLNGTQTLAIDNKIALFRKRPDTELSVVDMPHEGASNAIAWLDSDEAAGDKDSEVIPGRSVWHRGSWQDRDVRISAFRAVDLK